MVQAIVLPKLGNTVESAIMLRWHVAVGAAVKAGDVLCEVETDKAVLEVESSASGHLLTRFCEAGDDVPVLQTIAVVGQEGEPYAEFAPPDTDTAERTASPRATPSKAVKPSQAQSLDPKNEGRIAISPRAMHLAVDNGIDYSAVPGSGPKGRIIERDIRALIDRQPRLSPVAKKMLDSGDFQLATDAAARSRVTKADLHPAADEMPSAVKATALQGVRKTIAKRMLESLQTTAQLTLHRSADATTLQRLRVKFKESDKALGLRGVTINDLLLYAVARTLPAYPELNARFENETIYQHLAVQLGMAVDTERGLLAPVIRNAETLNLRQLSGAARRLSTACRDGKVMPDELTGGTFTVTNLGGLDIETFTPILNPPQVAILGIGAISLKPVEGKTGIEFLSHIALSLTVNHQVVDGAPAARFLAQLARNLMDLDMLLVADCA